MTARVLANPFIVLSLLLGGAACGGASTEPASAGPRSSAIEASVAGGVSRGTLTVPATAAPWPIVIILAGSGPTNRDGNPAGGPNNDCLKLLADSLARQGVASLRYDKRGVGASAALAQREADLRLEDYVADAVAWARMMSADSRFRRIIFAGHSEGALIATLAAQQSRVGGVVLLEGAGRPASQVLIDQLAPSLPLDALAGVRTVLASLDSGKIVNTLPASIPADLAAALFRPSVQPYLISWLKYDPSAELRRLTAAGTPSLVVHGTNDLQVFAIDGELLAAASSNPEVRVVGMNHVLRIVADLTANVASYSAPGLPVASAAVQAVVKLSF